MTRKDYVNIAQAIKVSSNVSVGSTPEWIVTEVLYEVADNIASELKRDNARFNRDTFMKACGLAEREKYQYPA